MVVRFLKTTSWVITRILPKRQGQNCTLKNFREVDEDHNYVKARRAPLIPKISWELEKHESSTTATNAVACPRKKVWFTKGKEGSIWWKKRRSIDRSSSNGRQKQNGNCNIFDSFFTFFPRALIAPMNDRIEFRIQLNPLLHSWNIYLRKKFW